MTKLLNAFLYLTFFFTSCSEKESPKYYWVAFLDKQYEKADTNQILHIDTINAADENKISFFSKHDTIQYTLGKSNRDSSFIDGFYTKHGQLRPLADTSILLDKETCNITTYILDEFVADGASLHYYEPTIGIYAVHSSTWPGIIYLQTSDSLQNSKIKKLMKATIPEFFIRGLLAKKLNE